MPAQTHALSLAHSAPRRGRFSLFSRILRLQSVSRQRRHLKDLPDYLLEDIGLSRGQAVAESKRPAWDAPRHWRA